MKPHGKRILAHTKAEQDFIAAISPNASNKLRAGDGFAIIPEPNRGLVLDFVSFAISY